MRWLAQLLENPVEGVLGGIVYEARDFPEH